MAADSHRTAAFIYAAFHSISAPSRSLDITPTMYGIAFFPTGYLTGQTTIWPGLQANRKTSHMQCVAVHLSNH